MRICDCEPMFVRAKHGLVLLSILELSNNQKNPPSCVAPQAFPPQHYPETKKPPTQCDHSFGLMTRSFHMTFSNSLNKFPDVNPPPIPGPPHHTTIDPLNVDLLNLATRTASYPSTSNRLKFIRQTVSTPPSLQEVVLERRRRKDPLLLGGSHHW